MSLTRVAIVTGSAQGIGRAIALQLARDGCDVLVNDIPSKREALDTLVSEIQALNRKSCAVAGDVSKEADVQKLIDTAADDLGGLDIMIANAGIARCSLLTSTPVEDWDLIQAINVRSIFLCYKAAAIQMIKQGRGGRIIGASSVAGKQGVAEWAPYSASKFAIKGLTQSAAAELSKHGITVNAYAPGVVNTPIWKDVEASRDKHGLGSLKETKAAVPEGMVLSSDDVAGLVSYLASGGAKFVTGQTMNVNGGMYFD